MRPNFVFILADGLGYADLRCYGGRSSCSPELDAMAGKYADLLVVNGNPLKDLRVLQNPDHLLAIVKGGVFVKRAL